MIPKLIKALLATGAALCVTSLAQAQFVDSLNSGLTPATNRRWAGATVAFQYMPSFNYTLGEIDTFLSWNIEGTPTMSLTVDLWAGLPANGTLLGSTTMTGTSYGWSSAIFATPIQLSANSTYSIGFYNIAGYSNYVNSGNFTNVPFVWYSNSEYNTYVGAWGTGAILGFKAPAEAVTPVPEPSTYGLLGAAALSGLIAFRRRRARK